MHGCWGQLILIQCTGSRLHGRGRNCSFETYIVYDFALSAFCRTLSDDQQLYAVDMPSMDDPTSLARTASVKQRYVNAGQYAPLSVMLCILPSAPTLLKTGSA